MVMYFFCGVLVALSGKTIYINPFLYWRRFDSNMDRWLREPGQIGEEQITLNRARFYPEIDWNYLDSLNGLYNEFFFRYDKSPLLIINSENLDFVNNVKDLNLIFDFITKPEKGIRYFNPVKDLT